MNRRVMLVIVTMFGLLSTGGTRGTDTNLPEDSNKPADEPNRFSKVVLARRPEFNRAAALYEFSGPLKEYLTAVSDNWLKVAPSKNPVMLEAFATRDQKPGRDLLPFSGEFAGKYLTGAVEVNRLISDKQLENRIRTFVDELIKYQAEDGYLGPFPKEYQFTGSAPNVRVMGGVTWETWNHYHIMLGLLLWYEQSKDANALNAAIKVGDLLCSKFLGKPDSMASVGTYAVNLAPIHSLCLLYKETGNKSYLNMARQICMQDFPKGGDFLQTALKGKEFYESPNTTRWEGLHAVMGLAELYWITGEDDYRKAFEHIWWSIVKTDRHNTGAFSSEENAVGNPYDGRSIETCCTVAWTALTVEMLKLTGNSIVADELELTLLNATLGYESKTGRWCTYNTPMGGVRAPSTSVIAFQKVPGGEGLNCCNANSARGIGLLSEWALMTDQKDNLIVNWYGSSKMSTTVGRIPVKIEQMTDYPRTGHIIIKVLPAKPLQFALKLRIPHWSEKNRIIVNGALVNNVVPGSYAVLDRIWKRGDKVEIDFDMSLHYWAGENQLQGKSSVYYGPLLLAYNPKNLLDEAKLEGQWKQSDQVFSADEIGAKLTCTFSGNFIRWVGKSYDDAGKAQIKIDGKEAAVIDQYVPATHLGYPFYWETQVAEKGNHQIEIILISDKNDNSKGNYINITELSCTIPVLDAKTIKYKLIEDKNAIVCIETIDTEGHKICLRDFAGAGGSDGYRFYTSWLDILNVPVTPFSNSNPLRSSKKVESESINRK